jgi:predicted 3-demethylubiquinone-9 3-methyltransferase (glyoxalase superfamily)
MPKTVATLLMFEGRAEEAMNFYTSLFSNSEIGSVERYGPNGPGPEGTIKYAAFTIGGYKLFCIDSPIKHAFTFTPATSIWVTCVDDSELNKAYDELSAGGQVLMALDNYGFSQKFGWVNDRFGVSWQLNLE